MKYTIDNILKLRKIRERWYDLFPHEKEEIWRDYHGYDENREPPNIYLVDRWFATLEDGIKIRKYKYFLMDL